MKRYKFLTIAGMDYDIDPDDNEPDTLLALNNFVVTEAELNDDAIFRKICIDQMVILGLDKFMHIGDYIFKDTSVVALAEKFTKSQDIETTIIEFEKREVLVGTDLEHAERKRAITPYETKIKLSLNRAPLGGYTLNVLQWTNDNDEDQTWGWRPLFWISLLAK